MIPDDYRALVHDDIFISMTKESRRIHTRIMLGIKNGTLSPNGQLVKAEISRLARELYVYLMQKIP